MTTKTLLALSLIASVSGCWGYEGPSGPAPGAPSDGQTAPEDQGPLSGTVAVPAPHCYSLQNGVYDNDVYQGTYHLHGSISVPLEQQPPSSCIILVAQPTKGSCEVSYTLLCHSSQDGSDWAWQCSFVADGRTHAAGTCHYRTDGVDEKYGLEMTLKQ